MGHKGHNGKIITYWLADCMEKAVSRSSGPNREICRWLLETNVWPHDHRLELVAFAMPTVPIFVAWSFSRLLVGCFWKGLGAYPNELRHTLCKWFLEVERHGRYLFPGSVLCTTARLKPPTVLMSLRSGVAANTIYNLGMDYLRAHLLLCKMSMRTLPRTRLPCSSLFFIPRGQSTQTSSKDVEASLACTTEDARASLQCSSDAQCHCMLVPAMLRCSIIKCETSCTTVTCL